MTLLQTNFACALVVEAASVCQSIGRPRKANVSVRTYIGSLKQLLYVPYVFHHGSVVAIKEAIKLRGSQIFGPLLAIAELQSYRPDAAATLVFACRVLFSDACHTSCTYRLSTMYSHGSFPILL